MILCTQKRFTLPVFQIFLASSQCSSLRKSILTSIFKRGRVCQCFMSPPPETGSKSVKGFESYFLSVSQALLQFRTPEASRTQSSPRKLTSVLWKRCWHKASNSTKLSQTTCEDAAINSVSVCDGEKCWLICVDIILAGRTNHYIKNLAKRNSLFIHLLLYLPLSYWNMCGVLCMPLHTCAD